jgi:hypothetical protein
MVITFVDWVLDEDDTSMKGNVHPNVAKAGGIQSQGV